MQTIREKLIHNAKNALENSYDKYSKVKVGAAILTNDERIFSGCNIENISFGLTICAERVALFKAVSEGYKDFKAIGIASSLNEPIFPCGACRQVLQEFEPDLIIYIDLDNKKYKLSDLLPLSFKNKF